MRKSHLSLVAGGDPTDLATIVDPVQLFQEAVVVCKHQLEEAFDRLPRELQDVLQENAHQTMQVLHVLENSAIIAGFRSGRLMFSEPPGPQPT